MRISAPSCQRTLVWFIATIVMTTTLVATLPPPALGHHTSCPDEPGDDTENDLANWPYNPACRNFVMDPGVDEFMDRADLLAGSSLYTSAVAGFSQNFLWYSRETTVTVTSDDVRWTSCRSGVQPGPGNYCPTSDIVSDYRGGVPHNPGRGGVLTTLHGANSADLSVFEYGGVWIAKVCGNWLETTERPKPIPTITVEKFRDDDGDQSRNGSEPPLENWRFEITPVTSPHGGNTASEIIETDASGRATFKLDGYGPGRYEISEITKPGWEVTTAATQYVEVPLGATDSNYTVEFGNRQIADVAKTDLTVVESPAEMAVGVPSTFVVDATIANLGPASPIAVDDTLAVEMLDDCTATNPSQTMPATLNVGSPQTLRFTYSITCAGPSFHPFTFEDTLLTTNPGVHDPDPTNNSAKETITIPVIATTDLRIVDPVLSCDRLDPSQGYVCDLNAGIGNFGPFGPVDATAGLDFIVSEECEATGGPNSHALTSLGTGNIEPIASQWQIECDPSESVRSFEVSLTLTADDMHVEDSDFSNNQASVTHTDLDIKPNSDPNSVNMKRKGVTSVAILSTDTFDAVDEVVQGTIKFGRSGTEAEALRCSPEDANGDGLTDLVCHFKVSETGFVDGDTEGVLTAELTDGSLLFSTDSIRILHGA